MAILSATAFPSLHRLTWKIYDASAAVLYYAKHLLSGGRVLYYTDNTQLSGCCREDDNGPSKDQYVDYSLCYRLQTETEPY